MNEAERDKARLDWVEKFIRKYGRSPEFRPDHQDLRSAIDAAMKANPLP